MAREGFPWFGDEMELLLNAPNPWRRDEEAEGNGASWQMVCNLTKSRLGGVGVGGLLEGEPRSEAKAWETYERWIKTGAQKAVAKKKPEGKGYVIEWSIRFNPCVEFAPGKFYSPTQGEWTVGLNLAVGDLIHPTKAPQFRKFPPRAMVGGISAHAHAEEQFWHPSPHGQDTKPQNNTIEVNSLPPFSL